MKKEFHSSCEGCPNYVLLNHFGYRAEQLEITTEGIPGVTLEQEGYIGCQRSRNNTPDDLAHEGPFRDCLADQPLPPKFLHTIMKVAGLTVYSETIIGGVPDLLGRELNGGGHWVGKQDYETARQQVSQGHLI